ncbi:MAG: aerial mycelium formation protein [Actinomycetota bacterium]|nr:MAG: aerial mycelium formation protein [Actinomycetota bacterium]
MTTPYAGGRRRIDRVLDPGFVAGLADLELADLRTRRREAEQEEADLSYLRRLLHGRIDIVTAELRHRDPVAAEAAVAEHLADVLADDQRSTRGLGRHLSVEPSRVDEHRRAAEAVVADPLISDVTHRSDAELQSALARLRRHERDVSTNRHAVQTVVDALSAELTRRYRDGSASVDTLLSGQRPPSG